LLLPSCTNVPNTSHYLNSSYGVRKLTTNQSETSFRAKCRTTNLGISTDVLDGL